MRILSLLFFSAFLFVAFPIWGSPNEPEKNSDESQSTEKTHFTNPVSDGADPWITKVKNTYYTCRSTGRSIIVTSSQFLTKYEESKEVWKCPDTGWNAFNLWAPELHHIKGKWYIYYAASDRDGAPFDHQRTGVLEADSPFGPYVDKGVLITGNDPDDDKPEHNIWAIDLHPFSWKGKLYAVWSGWDTQVSTDQTPQHLYIAEMKAPTALGKRHLLSKAEEPWELGDAFGLQEGPSTLIRNDTLFIVYSTRGSWTKDYRLGYLKLKPKGSPLDASSWTKSASPVFQGTKTVHGVGHASFTTSPDGKEHWIYYHAKKTPAPGWDRDLRLQPFNFNKDNTPNFGALR